MRLTLKLAMILGSVVIGCFIAYGLLTWGKSMPKPPHIVIILADDMGWNDVSFHGANEIPTRNIDALAYNGVILNKHYVLPICTPSRSALMTGRYPIRDGMQGWPMKPGEPRGIPLNVTLLPEYLKRLGYETRLVGKWHVGYTSEDYTPARRGFDSFFGYYNGFITYYDSWIGWDDTNQITGYDLHRDESDRFKLDYSSEYFTDLITDEAEQIIKNNKNEKPLFLEIAHLAVHTGARVYDDPLEVRRTDDVNASFPYINDYQRRKYAAMITAMDESVGRVVKSLKDSEMLENSIIIFMADNGAPTIGMYNNTGSNYPMRGIKGGMFEGAVRGAACIFSPLIKAHSRVSEELIHIVDWLPTLYTAAGGNQMDLIENSGGLIIDGVSQWNSLVFGDTYARESLLVNINEVSNFEAAIIGRHKLVKGMKGEDGYYGVSGNDPSYPDYDVDGVLSSVAGASIGNLTDFVSPSARRALSLRRKSTLSCNPSTIPIANCSVTCLFDLLNDPCETQDLSDKLPLIVKELELYIDEFRLELMAQTNSPQDLCALPKYFNGSYMPWRTIDEDDTFGLINSTTCHHPQYAYV